MVFEFVNAWEKFGIGNFMSPISVPINTLLEHSHAHLLTYSLMAAFMVQLHSYKDHMAA
jgi:hypothetical protein